METVTRVLGDVCNEVGGIIRTGPFGSQLHESDYVDEGLPVVMPKNILDGRVSLEGIAMIGDADAERLRQHRLRKGDIVYGRRGDIGRRALITDRENGWLCGTGCMRVSLGDSVLDAKYLSYYLGQQHVINWIYNQAVGATMPNLNTSILRSVPITYPPLSTQRKIAAILSAYDDLIENNTRRIKILEEMAQAIYREWFVNFRFPGHEKVRMVESELGLIPEGWEVRQIGDVVQTTGGGTPSTKCSEYWDGGDINWFSPSDLTAAGTMFLSGSSKRITPEGLQKSSTKMFPPYSVMMTSRATIGVVAINSTPACCNQGFVVCVSNHLVDCYHLYFWVLENKEKIVSIASGATFKEISRSEFRELPILVVDEGTRHLWAEAVGPLCKQVETLGSKNRILRQTRDLLLPKLVSGEVDVAGLDIAVGGGPEA